MVSIIVSSKNGANNIRLSRLATRQSNREEDLAIWRILISTPCSKLLPKTKKNKNGRIIKDTDYNKAMEVGHTISERIVSRYADYFGINSIDEVTTSMIQEIAQKYLDADELIQLAFCRDPSRQSIDEDVQLSTLSTYLTDCKVDKPTNGSMTLVEGDIVSKPKDKKAEARSIDFDITKDQFQFFVFAKYAAVSGSGQQAQAEECERFIGQAKKYIDKHSDNKYFIVLIDGAWGETHIPHLNDLAAGYQNIFAGNCESVIDFIQSIK